jgi:hypothetical protein
MRERAGVASRPPVDQCEVGFRRPRASIRPPSKSAASPVRPNVELFTPVFDRCVGGAGELLVGGAGLVGGWLLLGGWLVDGV